MHRQEPAENRKNTLSNKKKYIIIHILTETFDAPKVKYIEIVK